jgi:hypothetical protein
MTLWLLVDTSVWLDLAKDWRQQPVIRAMRESARYPRLDKPASHYVGLPVSPW